MAQDFDKKEIPPHVARLVRNAILNSTEKAERSVGDWCIAFEPKKPPKPANAVRFYADQYYKRCLKQGNAIFKLVQKGRYRKRNLALIGDWVHYEGQLKADVTSMQGYPEPNFEQMFDSVITRHVLEQIAIRLDSIKHDDIRNELCSAIAGLTFMILNKEDPGAEVTLGDQPLGLMAKTPHGVAFMKYNGDLKGPTITTWVSDEMAFPDQLEGWAAYSCGPGQALETANGQPVYRVRIQSQHG